MSKRRTWLALAAALTFALAGSRPAAAQAPPAADSVPGAPSGLTTLVNGGYVSLTWTHATGPFTHYVVEAGFNPGETVMAFPTSVFANPSLLTQYISAIEFSGIAPGSYYVRIRAANGNVLGPPTPDAHVTVSGGCVAPSVPTDVTGITRTIPGTTFAWLQWNAGSGGYPTSYTLFASVTPDGPPIVAFPLNTPYFNLTGVPDGQYYVSVVAQNACGVSAPSSPIAVNAPSSNLPARTPDPVNGGRLPLPFVKDIVQMVVDMNPGLLDLPNSCPGYNDDVSRLVKYDHNRAIDTIVDTLRLIDTRFGYNAKPTRGPADNGGQPVVVAGDEIAYHYGADAPEGSPNVHLVDLVNSHCGGTATLTWRNFTFGEFGVWTGGGRF